MSGRGSIFEGVVAGVFSLLLAGSMLLSLDEASAHPPSGLVLEYFPQNATLKVTITHNSPTPNYHYIGTVDILKNGELDSTNDYTSQPSTTTFTYEYSVQAANGDRISARAVCSIAGELTSEITVEGPVLPLTLDISPGISSVEEGADRDFTVNAYSGSDPVDGVTMTIDTLLGTASEMEPLGIGGYQFTYSAPSVDADSEETLSISGVKNGYEDASLEISFTVTDLDSPEKVRIEFADPPKTVEEGSDTTLTVLCKSGSDPVAGAAVSASANIGGTGAVSEGDPGEYSFVFTAPDVSIDTKVTITVTASSPPLTEGSGTLQFTVRATKKPLDGTIRKNEYAHSATTASGDLELYWTIEGSELSMGLKGRTGGWIAIGFGAASLMKDADIVMGYVSAGKATVLDCFSTGNYGPHPPDAQLGGADNLIATGATESGEWTVMEFSRSLDSPDDRFDNDINPSQGSTLIWAMGSNDDPSAQHDGSDIKRGTYSMDWSKSTTSSADNATSAGTIWFGAIGIFLAVCGITLIATRKKAGALKKAGMNEKAIIFAGIGLIIGSVIFGAVAISLIE